MSYRPGLHLIATLHSAHATHLLRYEAFKDLLDALVVRHQLQALGHVYHNFTPAGFTAVLCLSESHLSIHTWPEYQKINLDIYLSNHERQNDGTVLALFDAVKTFFEATVVHQQNIVR